MAATYNPVNLSGELSCSLDGVSLESGIEHSRSGDQFVDTPCQSPRFPRARGGKGDCGPPGPDLGVPGPGPGVPGPGPGAR